MVAVGFAARNTGGDFEVVAVGESGAQAMEFVFEAAEGAENLVAILLEDRAPDLWVAAGDARGVAQAAAGVVAPRRIFCGEKSAKTGRDDLRQVADVRDDFVVLVRRERHDLGAECVPKFDDGGGGLGGSIHERSDETGAVFEQSCGAVFPAGFLGAGHGVRADEVGVGCEGGVTEAGDFVFHAADVGDERAGGKVRGDLTGEGDDLVDGCGDHDETGVADGIAGGLRDGVAPWLRAKFEP